MRFVTIDDREWRSAVFLFCLVANGGSCALADPGAISKHVLSDERIVYSDQPIPGGKPVKDPGQFTDSGSPPGSRLTPWEQNATLPEVAGTDRVDLVKDRLAHGADPNVPGGSRRATPLHAAAEGGRTEIVDLLLRAGADLNLVPPRSHWGPALCAAAFGNSPGHAEVTRMLLKNTEEWSPAKRQVRNGLRADTAYASRRSGKPGDGKSATGGGR